MAKRSNVNISPIAIIRLIVFIFLGLVIFGIYTRANDFLTKSPLFAVQDVVIDTSIQFIDTAELRRLKGRNIFSIDITKLHNRLKSQYPQIAQLRVMRQLPNRIMVLAKKRDGLFTAAHRSKTLLVDTEGVAMYYPTAPVDLPRVTGALGNQSRVLLGAPLADKNVAVTVQLLQAFRSKPHLARLKVMSVDVSNLSKIEMGFNGGFRVIVDQDGFLPKLDVLDMLVAQRKIDFIRTRYVDLRFNEPVLGENDTETK